MARMKVIVRAVVFHANETPAVGSRYCILEGQGCVWQEWPEFTAELRQGKRKFDASAPPLLSAVTMLLDQVPSSSAIDICHICSGEEYDLSVELKQTAPFFRSPKK